MKQCFNALCYFYGGGNLECSVLSNGETEFRLRILFPVAKSQAAARELLDGCTTMLDAFDESIRLARYRHCTRLYHTL